MAWRLATERLAAVEAGVVVRPALFVELDFGADRAGVAGLGANGQSLRMSSSPSPGGGKLKTPLPPTLSLKWKWTIRGRAKAMSAIGSAPV